MTVLLKKRYSLIIFDWDGTVVDSVPSIVEALRRSAMELVLPVLSESRYRAIIGLSLRTAFLNLHPELDEGQIVAMTEAYKKHYLTIDAQASGAFAGAAEGLQQLHRKGVKLAIATGKGRGGLQRSVDANNLGHLFHASRTSDDAHSKPDPDMLKQILAELDVPIEQALMVGDSGFDMQMAKRAGMDRIAVTYGAQSAEKLRSWAPVMIADNFDELMDWLEVRQTVEVI